MLVISQGVNRVELLFPPCRQVSLLQKLWINSCQCCSGLHYDWAVNFAAACPSNDSLVAVVGDDPVAQLTDLKTGKPAAALKGHLDYSFAAAWHPDGNLLATGNQVCSMSCSAVL